MAVTLLHHFICWKIFKYLGLYFNIQIIFKSQFNRFHSGGREGRPLMPAAHHRIFKCSKHKYRPSGWWCLPVKLALIGCCGFQLIPPKHWSFILNKPPYVGPSWELDQIHNLPDYPPVCSRLLIWSPAPPLRTEESLGKTLNHMLAAFLSECECVKEKHRI